MNKEEIIQWLLEGDPAIRYQTCLDLLREDRRDIQELIEKTGWGRGFLDQRREDGHWGLKFYQPKWTSSHYTLLDLRSLCMPPGCKEARDSIAMIASGEKGPDGGINPAGSIAQSDVCINGMFLDYATWFGADEESLHSVVDFILSQVMADGGFNCRSNRSGAVHSSMHSTICVCEGIAGYRKKGYSYRLGEMEEAETGAGEFLLKHRLFLSDRTGEVIHKDFLRLSYPCRWRYDILRALDYFRYSGAPRDERMKPAIGVLREKRNRDGTWNTQAKHPGKVHFNMEEAGSPGRWNTLRAVRVLEYFDGE